MPTKSGAMSTRSGHRAQSALSLANVVASGPGNSTPAILEPSPRTAAISVEERGYGDILNALSKPKNRHFYVPARAEEVLAAEDLEYLKSKGCFNLPGNCKELIKAYFQYVHPTFPVIDAAPFLQSYAVSGLKGINLLLLWSMISVSASYVANSPQKAYKKTYANRAKLLFDLTQENDKIVLVQSALLLSFWFEDGEDVKQSWYWSSIAISVAQTLGLHCEIELAATTSPVTQLNHWRHIWQCCIYRDVWLAFGMGRPLRIRAEDCNASLIASANGSFASGILYDQEVYRPEEETGFAKSWRKLIAISHVLRDIISDKELTTAQDLSLRDRPNATSPATSSVLLTRVNRHLELHQNAAIIAMARRGGMKELSNEVADATTTTLQALLNDGSLEYAAPVIIPLLVPAAVTYLSTAKSAEAEARCLAHEKLKVYVEFLSALEDNYPAASILSHILEVTLDAMTGETIDQKLERAMHSQLEDQIIQPWDLSWTEHAWLPGTVGRPSREDFA
ncbi:hypothetical protein EK21DRAFT_93088 [Setomelanomma holmii]|uniref:Xylanolytic transcriptional activator regulatory domain-containing protein n=1 Tax=Setomelanomma holmii TaxID=210430 RepID=A0A9P4LHW2_9PLEO|nr:hypothetical protein EK21DRAFT_93088 [Setomelanomma holmii]